MTFGAPLSGAILGTSAVAPVVAIGICASARWVAIQRKDRLRRRMLPVLVLLFVALFALVGLMNYWFAPVTYEVTDRAVTVHMRRCRKTIPLAAIRSAHVDTQRQLASAYSPWRMFTYPAVVYSGPWGLVSECTLPGRGRVRAYVTDPQRAVVLETQPLTVVSPEHPAAFVAAIQAALVGAKPPAGT